MHKSDFIVQNVFVVIFRNITKKQCPESQRMTENH